jgi:hypothetical protein
LGVGFANECLELINVSSGAQVADVDRLDGNVVISFTCLLGQEANVIDGEVEQKGSSVGSGKHVVGVSAGVCLV